MFKASRLFSSVCLSAALCLAACGGGAELLLIPLFEFGFSGSSGGVALQVFFLPDKPTTTSGNFDQVNFNVGAAQFAYTGSYSGCTFTLSSSKSVVGRNGTVAPAKQRQTLLLFVTVVAQFLLEQVLLLIHGVPTQEVQLQQL